MIQPRMEGREGLAQHVTHGLSMAHLVDTRLALRRMDFVVERCYVINMQLLIKGYVLKLEQH